MDNRMFCFQCEQTAGCAGCTGKAGVCGKTTEVAELQDQLTGALVGLSRAVDNAPDTNEGTWRLMIEGLFTTVTNVNFNEKTIRELIDQVHEEKARLVPGCSGCGSRCGRNDDQRQPCRNALLACRDQQRILCGRLERCALCRFRRDNDLRKVRYKNQKERSFYRQVKAPLLCLCVFTGYKRVIPIRKSSRILFRRGRTVQQCDPC